MSFSVNHRSKKNSLYYFRNKYLENHNISVSSRKRGSAKNNKSNTNLPYINYQIIQNNFSNSSVNTNITNIKGTKEHLLFNIYPIKPKLKDKLEYNFNKKRIIVYKPPSIVNNKKISFQKKTNKEILEFPLFDEKLIFKDINRSYLQDKYSDEGSESGDELINQDKSFLSQELEDSIKLLSLNLKKNKNNNLLSRYMKFKE